jgi:hypothetical protein
VLEKQAKSKWIDQHLKTKNINKEDLEEGQKSRYDAYMELYKGDMDAIIEEAIADAFGDFDVNKAPPGLMQAILTRLRNFFDAVKTAFGGEVTAEQVFRKVEKGALKAEAKAEAAPAKQSLRIMRGEEKPGLTGKVTVDRVGAYFDAQIQKEFGRKLDYSNPQDFDRAVQLATEEVKYQMELENSGLDWYEQDIQKSFKDTAKVIPELKKTDNKILFSVMAGIMSPQTTARDNWFIAAKAFEHYVKTGDIPGINPENGNLWMGGTQSANKKIQLEFLDRMVKDIGQKKALQWLMSPHPVKEINDFRLKYGNIKSGIEGKATDIKPGLYAFGPKVGPFVSNINGIHDVTVDKWFTRTFNRYFGTMIGPDGKIIDAPTEPQRRFIKQLANKVAEDAGIKNYQVQSLLWFYEQRLFTELGAQSPSYGFSDGAAKFVESRGKGGAAGVPVAAAAVGKVKPSLRAPQTETFKRWFGDSKVVNEDGTPKVMYHGTARDITEFRPKQAGAIFVTDSPDFAEMFADVSNGWIAKHYKDFLSADQIKAAKNNVPRILNEMGYRGDEAASYKKQIDMDSPSGGALDVWTTALKEQLPTGPNVMPLFVRAEKPFDYENSEHIEQLNKYEQDNRYTERTISNFVGSVKIGSWEAIESRKIQDAIKSLGFDGFYVKEGGIKNLAVYKPEQLKSATGNIGTFDPTNPDIRYSLRDKLGMYSELETKIEAGSNKAPAASWKAYINGLTQKGVKPEEIEWSGVRDWLDLQKGTVTKEELLNYLKQGGVKVEEVVLSKSTPQEDETDFDTGRYDEFDGTKYGKYTLPGGENYREVLLTLPVRKGYVSPDVERVVSELPRGVVEALPRGAVEPFAESLAERFGVNRREMLDGLLYIRGEKKEPGIAAEYRSSHWDQPNVLAHIRVNDRTDADGNKVLFVEEIQSDWGQEGKKVGFKGQKGDPLSENEYKRALELQRLNRETSLSEQDRTELDALMARHTRAHDALMVPTAPFVTKTEGWLNLALKRIMVMAAEGGYDKVAFVNGEQSADRYDLSKQVESISYRDNGDGTYKIVAAAVGRGIAIPEQTVERNNLPDVVGKEIADKIISGEGKSFPKGSVSEGMKELTGLDLKVGGEGMKTFYDTIVPTALKKLLPKVGGGQMTNVDLLKDSMKKYDRFLMKDDLRILGEEGFRAKYAHNEQPGFDVTDAMREKVQTTGLPRFSLREAKGVGYHAGDLGYGRDTTLGKMSGGRGTGHFGTGVYFVGSPDKIKGRDERPVKEVDLSGYRLYRPDDKESARQLHDALREVNALRGMYDPEERTQSKEFEDKLNKAAFDLWINILPRGLERSDVKEIIRGNVINAANEFKPVAYRSNYVDSASTRVMKALGFEGVDVRGIPDYDNVDYGTVVYTDEFKPKQAKLSLRVNIPASARARVVATTVTRQEKGFVERLMEAISPTSYSDFRAQALNRYNQLGVYDKIRAKKMGGAALLADQSAESAALLSDVAAGLVASALGVHDRMGGIPVFRNGITIISNQNGTIKGPTAIFAPLAADPAHYQDYQFWAGVKRGSRYMQNPQGKYEEKLFTPSDVKEAEVIRKAYLKAGIDFEAMQKEWIKYNDGLVQYMVDTGVLSQERADLYRKHADYLPFYRQMDGRETIGPKVFQAISGVKPPKAAKGGEALLDDFLENIVRNTQSAIQAGVKNVAAQRAAKVAMDIGMASRLNFKSSAAGTFDVLENGQVVTYQAKDELFINAIKSLGIPDLPFIGLLSGPANLLRNLVTKDPGFMLANLMRDSMSAWVTSGVKMTPMVNTFTNFGAAIAGKDPAFQALMNAGILGGYEFSQNVEQSGREFGKALRKQAGIKSTGLKGAAEMGAKPFTSLWDALEKGSTASDAATRMEVYKRTLAETGNEAEALFRALEVMNFNRKGSSAVVRILTAAVPFLNARMQGLDVLYRAASGQMNARDAAQIQKQFFVRGAMMASLSAAYWLLTHDDEEYKKQEQETRDNYWLLPSLGVKIPIPFEIGVLFKVIPERILGYTFGSDTGEDFLKSMARQLTSTLAFNPIPQAVMPVVETMTNFSFFTMRPIVGQGMEGLQPAYQVGPGTSRLAEGLGEMTKGMAKELQVSPMKIDQLISGYTGTMGMYLMNLMDAVYDMNTDSPKPARRFEQMPLIRRFALDPEARGNVTAYYELKNSVDSIVRTSNMLERTMNYEELPGYLMDNMRMLASKDYILDLEKTMKEFREMKILIRSASMDADAKKEAILAIDQMENQLTSNIQYMKKLAKGD